VSRGDVRAAHLSALLDALGTATRAVAGAADRAALLDGACRALAGRGGFAMAWIGADEDGDGWLERLAVAGDDSGYTNGIRISADDIPEGRGPTGTALRTGETFVCNDVASDDRIVPWRERLLTAGFRSSAASPIRSRRVPCAVLSVYTRTAGAFGPQEASVLAQLAETIGLGLDSLAAHEATLVAERRYEQLAARLPIGLYIFRSSPDGAASFDYLSPPAGRILGIDPDRAVRDAGYALSTVHPDDVAGLVALTGRFAADPAPFRWEGRFIVDGDTRVVRLESEPERVEAGLVVWRGTVADVTAQRSAEAALRESEARFRAAFEGNPETIGIFRPEFGDDGRFVDAVIVYANWIARHRYLGGRPLEEVAGSRLFERWPHYRDLLLDLFVDVAEHRMPVFRELSGTGLDGEWWSDTWAFPFEGGFALVGRDVTRRRKAETAAKAADDIRRRAEAIAHLGSWRVDLKTGEAVRSDECLEIFGVDQASAPPNALEMLTRAAHSDDRERILEAIQATASDGQARALDGRIVRGDGATRWIRGEAEAERDATGQIVALAGFVQDVTEAHQAREAYERSQRLDALALLAAGVAHDFRNILSGIDLVATEMRVEQPTRGLLDSESALIHDAVAHGSALVAQLQDFARPRTTTGSALDAGAALRSLEPILHRLVGHTCHVALSLAADIGSIRLERGQLEQVLINLVVNARDAMPSGGTISISAAPAELAASGRPDDLPPGRYLQLTVADTGAGVAPAVLERIFLPYFTTKGAAGSGLGLATVQGIVRSAGGSITADSAVGEGATFRILLPMDGEAARES
jgi:PAS domain S-box-containing protein